MREGSPGADRERAGGCDCVCAVRHPSRPGVCDGRPVTAIWPGGIEVQLCAPCTGPIGPDDAIS